MRGSRRRRLHAVTGGQRADVLQLRRALRRVGVQRQERQAQRRRKGLRLARVQLGIERVAQRVLGRENHRATLLGRLGARAPPGHYSEPKPALSETAFAPRRYSSFFPSSFLRSSIHWDSCLRFFFFFQDCLPRAPLLYGL